MNEEFKNKGFGAKKSPFDIRDFKFSKKAKKACMAEQFPEEFTLPIARVKDQGSVGSCVAHSISEVIEYFNKTQTGMDDEMSVGYIYGNRRNSLSKDSGMYTREALDNAVKYGDVKRSEFPENKEVPEIIDLFEKRFNELKDKGKPYAITSYLRVNGESEMKHSLMTNGPIVIAVRWFDDFHLNLDGVMQSKLIKKPGEGYHCMMIYGWNEKGWKVLNSWGVEWGKAGTFIYPYNFPFVETWGVCDTNITNDDIVEPMNNWFLNLIAQLINLIINFFAK